MTTRVLRPEEYWRLAGTEAAALGRFLTDAARVVVVEDHGAIVGCHVLQPILHAEGLWIAPEYRKKVAVGRRLWSGVQREVREHFGVKWFATGCASETVKRFLDRLGAKKLPDHYMVPVEESCQPS